MKIKAKDFYALICDDTEYTPKEYKAARMICGIYASKAEALEVKETIKDCLCKHYIKKCKVTVEF